MIRTRILSNVVGNGFEYRRGQIVNLQDGYADNLIDAGFAMHEPPGASGVIVTHLENAGYSEVVPGPSGYGFVGPSGVIISDPPSDGGYYFPYIENPNVIRIVFPGEVEEDFELLKLLPRRG